MHRQFDELTRSVAQPVARRTALKRLGRGACIMLACFGLVNAVEAQTTVVCDPAGDAVYGSGNGGPQVPAWLDIAQTVITDAGNGILFTLTVNEPIPLVPDWKSTDDKRELWWSWRLIDDVAKLTFVSNGCLQANGQKVPAVYCLDLIWNVQSSSFRARLLDDTSCSETAIPMAFSPDRREVVMLVPKALLTNAALVPDPNSFQVLTETVIWKSGSNSNTALAILDNAPSQTGGPFMLANWSSSTSTTYGCP